MGIDTLIETLEANARRRAAGILREARAEARDIRRRAEREEAHHREEILDRRARALETELAAEMARVRAEGRRAALEARRVLLDRVFERARERLPEATRSLGFRTVLPERIARAATYLAGDEAVVACPPELAEVVQAAVVSAGESDPPRIRVETDPEVGAGFRLRSPDDRVTVDDTLTGRLARGRAELEIALLARLDGADGEEER